LKLHKWTLGSAFWCIERTAYLVYDMKTLFRLLSIAFFVGVFSLALVAQQNPAFFPDPLDVRFIDKPVIPNAVEQERLRDAIVWRSFLSEHGTWFVHFNEANGLPHRAYGKPIPVSGNSPEDRAWQFVQNVLSPFVLPIEELAIQPAIISGKHDWVNFYQIHQGLLVLGSRVVVKMSGNDVIQFGCDVYPVSHLNTQPTLSAFEAETVALSDITGLDWIDNSGELHILPVPGERSYHMHLVYSLTVHCRDENGVPSAYYTLIDAHSGQLLYRDNTVRHHGGKPQLKAPESYPPVNLSTAISGMVYESSPWTPAVSAPLANLQVTVSGTNYFTDDTGVVNVPANPGTSATVRLMGPWARIYTSGNTPQQNVTLQPNSEVAFTSGNLRERSAFASIQRIHAHMKTWLPAFTGMDFPLETNIDVTGTCNAFYNGNSINFYNTGAGCNATSLVADVVYHEYGHGINDKFYQSSGGQFSNGAMNEGYADFWAISLSNNPVMASGFYTDNQNGIRRYNGSPKVYPNNIVGEVHADGEIIMGAWWTTHNLLGADWNLTMSLFTDAYSGLQAFTFNGNEGVAFTDVLIDVLQADDNDGDITNGTPNGDAIILGFYTHGITLLSNASLSHNGQQFVAAQTPLTLNATLNLQFPFTTYLQQVECHYRINNGEWVIAPMNPSGGNQYTLDLEGQEPATVMGYFLAARDVNNAVSNVIPRAAALSPFPNLPYYVLVGVQVAGIHDCDDNEDWGIWQTGIPGDNAGTGMWVNAVPIGSQTTDVSPGTIVQPFNQMTPGGEYCFVTGNAVSVNSPIGEADVDGGHTTLQSTLIDMSSYAEPIVSYWRWYTNDPPGGANPGADYWQVLMSNNGGQSWTYVENTLTSDMRWRRNAFRVRDFLEPTNQMRFRFIASDSIRPGEYLEGGSLVEAAVDDFFIFDAISVGMEELRRAQHELVVWPNPFPGNELNLSFAMTKQGPVTVGIYAENGQLVFTRSLGQLPSGVVQRRLTIPPLAAGSYLIEVGGSESRVARIIVR